MTCVPCPPKLVGIYLHVMYSMCMSTLAQRFYARRKTVGLSQVQLAEASGISQQAISRLETGITKRPRQEDIETLAACLDVSPGWLMFGEARNDTPHAKVRDLRRA